MSEKPDYSQLELFSQSDQESAADYRRKSGRTKPFFSIIRGYEKALLFIMALIVTGIVFYSLGVESGKRGLAPGVYTIQVAAFRERGAAVREYQALKINGFHPQAFMKGEYIILCVGKFSNLESAQPVLLRLQKTYAGCRIRRL